ATGMVGILDATLSEVTDGAFAHANVQIRSGNTAARVELRLSNPAAPGHHVVDHAIVDGPPRSMPRVHLSGGAPPAFGRAEFVLTAAAEAAPVDIYGQDADGAPMTALLIVADLPPVS